MVDRTRTAERSRRGMLALASFAAVAAVVLGLALLAGATVAADGRLIEPFAAIALSTLALTGAGIIGLGLAFREVRRRSTCGRDGC